MLALSDARADGARVVVTGCMAERYGDELAEACPTVDAVACSADAVRRVGVPVTLGRKADRAGRSVRPPTPTSRRSTCSTCPGPRRRLPGPTSRWPRGATATAGSAPSRASAGPAALGRRISAIDDLLAEVDAASTCARSCSSPRTSPRSAATRGQGTKPIVPLVEAVAARVERIRLLYLYPSDLTDALIDAILATGVALLRPVAPARVAARSCGGCAGGATAIGSSNASPRSGPPSPARRSAPTSSSATRVRPRPTTIAARVRRRGRSSTGAGSSRTRPRTAPTPPTSTAACPRADGRPPGRAARAPGRHHGARRRDALIGSTVEVLVDGPARRARTARRPRSTASSRCPTIVPGYGRGRGGHRCTRSRPRAGSGPTPKRAAPRAVGDGRHQAAP